MKNRLQKYLIYGLIATVPFERLLTFEVGSFTVKLSYLAAIVLVIYSIFNRKFLLETKLVSFEWVLLAFWLVSLATTIWSANRPLTFILNLVILLSFLIFFILRRTFKAIDRETITNYIIWLGVFASLFAFWQFTGDSLNLGQNLTGLSTIYLKNVFGFPRVQSTFFEPSFFANFLLVPLYLSLYLATVNHKRADHIKLVIIATAFFLTLSRGAFISLLLSFIILLAFFLIGHKTDLKKAIKPVLLLLASLAISLLFVYSAAGLTGVHNYFRQVRTSNDILLRDRYHELSPNRGYTVRVALENFPKYPFGLGTGAFGTLPEFASIRAAGNQRQTVNSIYPEVLIETGFMGLVLFLLFVFLLLKFLWKNSQKNYLSAIVFASALAIFIQFSSFSTYYLIYIWVFLAFAASLTSTDNRKQIPV